MFLFYVFSWLVEKYKNVTSMLMRFWSKISRMFLCMFLLIILMLKKCVFYTMCPIASSLGKIHLIYWITLICVYGIPKETVAAITILYRNTKVKVRLPDGDTEYFNIVAEVLQGDTLAPYPFIICLYYVLRTSIDKIRENGFELTKKRSRRYPAKQLPTPTTPMT